MNSISTKNDIWQMQCLSWAVSKEPFEIFDVKNQHFPFFDELRKKYSYEFSADDYGVFFKPKGVSNRPG